jgi:hypothetical protein
MHLCAADTPRQKVCRLLPRPKVCRRKCSPHRMKFGTYLVSSHEGSLARLPTDTCVRNNRRCGARSLRPAVGQIS